MSGDFAETIYKGRDNQLVLQVTKWRRGFPLLENGVSRVAVLVGAESFDSTAHPDVVAFDNDYITATLGPAVTSGRSTVTGSVVIFDASHPNGITVGRGTFTIV